MTRNFATSRDRSSYVWILHQEQFSSFDRKNECLHIDGDIVSCGDVCMCVTNSDFCLGKERLVISATIFFFFFFSLLFSLRFLFNFMSKSGSADKR